MLENGNRSNLCCSHCSRTSSASLAPLSFSHVASSSQQVSHLDLQRVPELDWMETGQQLTFIGHQVQVQWTSKLEGVIDPSVPKMAAVLAFLRILTIFSSCWFSLTTSFCGSVPRRYCNLSGLISTLDTGYPHLGTPTGHLNYAPPPCH